MKNRMKKALALLVALVLTLSLLPAAAFAAEVERKKRPAQS